MIIICKDENRNHLKRLLKEFLFLDVVVVEKGEEYEGLCYYFSMDNIDSLVEYLKSEVSKNHWIVGESNEVIEKVLIHKVIYIEGFSKEAYFYTRAKEYKTKERLYNLEEELKEYGFIRINKSIIVNIHEIKYIVPDIHSRFCLYMSNDSVLLLNRSYVKEFKDRLKMR